MSLALASRAARAQSSVIKRQIHSSNVVRSSHGDYHVGFYWSNTELGLNDISSTSLLPGHMTKKPASLSN